MPLISNSYGMELTAILIAQDRELADEFTHAVEEAKTFQIISTLRGYPTRQTLDLRLRQLHPDIIFVDLNSDLETACEVVQAVADLAPQTHIIGIHPENDSDALIRSLRHGARDFLFRPFDASIQLEIANRLTRLRAPDSHNEKELGQILAFASTKPGSGASTISAQLAFALKRSGGPRVLLIDLDLMGGTIGFYLKLNHPYSFVDAIEHYNRLNAAVWGSLVAHCSGVDILPAPEFPSTGEIPSDRLHAVLQYARVMYDWVIVDLPSIFTRSSLQMLTESDSTYLVSTSELPSLHLARKAIGMLSALGLTKDRFKLIVNRVNKKEGIGVADLEKIFGASVDAVFPNDYFSLHRVVTLGQPLGPDCDLGKAFESLARSSTGSTKTEKKRSRQIY